MDISIIIIINQIIGAFTIYTLLSKKLKVEKEQYIKLINNYQKLSTNFIGSQKKPQPQNDTKVLENQILVLTDNLHNLHTKLKDFLKFDSMYENFVEFQNTGKVPNTKNSGGTSNLAPSSDDKLNSIKRKRTTPEL